MRDTTASPNEANISPNEAKLSVVYILPSLKVGGVETAVGLSYSALSAALDIEYIILERDGANPQFAPSTRLTPRTFLRLIKKRKEIIVVTSLWRAHIVGLILRLARVHWVAFFHSTVNSGHWLNRIVCFISTLAADSCFFDSKRTQSEFEARAKRKLGYLIPFIFQQPSNVNAVAEVRDIDLIFVGRFVPVKRIDLCIQLIEHCISRNASFRAMFVGYGELSAAIDAAVLKYPNNIQNIGPLSNEAVRKHLRKAKMILCLSDVEGMAMAVIEGVQEGCVPVARLSGELNNYLNDESAVVYRSFREQSDVCNRLLVLANHPEMLKAMNNSARKNISGYSDYTTAFLLAVHSIANARQAKHAAKSITR